MKRLACVVWLLLASVATAQTVIVIDQPGTYILLDGKLIGPVAVLKPGDNPVPPSPKPKPDPPQPPSPAVTWQVTGLHVLIVDDENVRGNLPQEQINIFTSKPLKDWLVTNAARYRFSSNDSLKPGQPARELERPEFVAGWDLVADAVEKKAINLPAWIVSDGKKQVMGALPESVDAAMQKLGEFK